MKIEAHIAQAEALAPVSGEAPRAAFVDFYNRHRRWMGDALRALKEGDARMKGFTLRAGMMAPVDSVIDEKVRDFCRIPYRTVDGTIPSCPGILGSWKGCPPHSPPVKETIGLLSRARSFLIVQFDGREGHDRQRYVHGFISKLAEIFSEAGCAVLGTYACGPCRICAKGCDDGPDCRQPGKRIFALEACGFWVNRLCRKASEYPVCGDGPREVRWIMDWNLPTQDTESVRFVSGILLA